MVRLLSFVLAAFIFSCTIIEDSDITSQDELDGLQFTTIDITQETSSGTTNLTARVTSEKSVNLSSIGGTITRIVYMDWPALPATSKLKLKGGTTTAVRSYASYLASGKPWTFYLFSTGSDSTILEFYRFRYNTAGQLSNIITRIPYVVDGPATSNDTLIYDTAGKLFGVTRKFPANGTSTPFSGFEYNSSGQTLTLSQFIFQSMNYQIPCQGGGCGSYWGGNHHVAPGTNTHSNNFPTGVINITTFQREYLGLQDINNLSQYCNSNCSAFVDTYYLHPLMILKDHFSNGNDLLFVYMVDWWKPSTAQSASNNEKVTISFNYDF